MIRHSSWAKRGVVGTRFEAEGVDDVFDGLLAFGGQDVGGFVGEGELHRGVYENAAVEVVGLDDVFDDIEYGVELAERGGAAAVADHGLECVLSPSVLRLEGGEHQVFFALEVFVEGGLADFDVGEDLVDADAAEAIAVEAADGGLDETLAGGSFHRKGGKSDKVDQESTCKCTTSQLCEDGGYVDNDRCKAAIGGQGLMRPS